MRVKKPSKSRNKDLNDFLEIARDHGLDVEVVSKEEILITDLDTGKSIRRPLSEIELDIEPSPKK